MQMPILWKGGEFGIMGEEKMFNFCGRKFEYIERVYNNTKQNERAIELPIIFAVLDWYKERGGELLEFGNVTQHYRSINHFVIDKYEKNVPETENVINIDVVDFDSSKRFDLIYAISTLEHVGWDETLEEVKIEEDRYWIVERKLSEALKVLKHHLKPEGELVVTVPCNHNPLLNILVMEGAFSELHFMERTGLMEWKQCDAVEAYGKHMNNPYSNANAIVIGTTKAGLCERLKEERGEMIEMEKRFPIAVEIETTTKCSEDCWFCPRRIMKREKDKFMSDKLLEKIFDELKGKGIQRVHPFLYGEPFEDKRIFSIVDKIHSIGAVALIYSNATLIDEEVAKKIIAHGVDSLILTMTTNDKVSGPVVERVLKFLTMKGDQLPVTEIKVVRKDGRDDEFLNFWSKVPHVTAWVSGLHAIKRVDSIGTENKTKRCSRLENYCTILVDGTVCLCCNDFDAAYNQGNVNDQTIEEIWNSSKHLELIEKYPNLERCRWCDDGSRY